MKYAGTLLLTLLLLSLMGCTKPPESKLTPLGEFFANKPDPQTEWNLQLARVANAAADRMNECTIEIYSTGHGGGPVCRDACGKYAILLKHERTHPEFLAMLGRKETVAPKREICGKSAKELQ